MNFLTKFKKPARGIAILSLIFILTPMILVAVLGETLLSVNQNFDSVDTESGLRARSYADVAVKEALLRLSRERTYETANDGDDAVLLSPSADDNDSASFRVINESSTRSRVIAQGQSDEATKTIQVIVEFDELDQSHEAITWPNQREFPGDLCALADFDGDGSVNGDPKSDDSTMFLAVINCDVSSDYEFFSIPLEEWPGSSANQCYHYDLNLDGVVDLVDFAIIGTCDGWPF